MPKDPKASGLQGVVVGETALSMVDGKAGRLVIHGFELEDLTARAGFADVCHLLWRGRLPETSERQAIERELAHGRKEAYALLPELRRVLDLEDPMDALRACAAVLSPPLKGEPYVTFVRVTGALAVFSAAWWRRRRKAPILAPDEASSHAADYLRLVTGEVPAAARVRALETYLVTVADHGMNASTFTARVIASTGSDPISAIVGGIGALKGPLHGGAPGPVLDMLDAIGTPDAAEAWLENELKAGRRIMGMGHRIYQVRDPRAAVLERAVENLVAEAGESPRLALARQVEKTARAVLRRAKPDRALEANVEFYTAVLLEAVGLPRELFANTFATARVVGWTAHFQEQRSEGRLIRPGARYVGPMN